MRCQALRHALVAPFLHLGFLERDEALVWCLWKLLLCGRYRCDVLPDALIDVFELHVLREFADHGRLSQHLARVVAPVRRLVDLGGEEAPGFTELKDLLVIKLHEALVVLGESVLSKLTEAVGRRCVRVVRARRLLMQAIPVQSQDVRAVVPLDVGEFVPRLSLPRVVHGVSQFFFALGPELARDA